MVSGIALVFDADNTLWDTDSVFRSAQIALLGVLSEKGLLEEPEAELAALREVDQALSEQVGRFEYDFRHLVRALIPLYRERQSVEDAVAGALSTEADLDEDDAALVEQAVMAFGKRMGATPALYPGTVETLSLVRSRLGRAMPCAMAVFSEGDPKRLRRILKAHGRKFEGLFDDLIIAPKSVESFREAKRAVLRHLAGSADGEPREQEAVVVMVGDTLRRDVKFGNQAGFTTVYKPSPYKGREQPQGDDEEPDFTIGAWDEFPAVVDRLVEPALVSA